MLRPAQFFTCRLRRTIFQCTEFSQFFHLYARNNSEEYEELGNEGLLSSLQLCRRNLMKAMERNNLKKGEEIHIYFKENKLEFLKKFKKNEIIHFYNVLINMYGKFGKLEKVFEIFQAMRAENLHPNRVTYGIIIELAIKNQLFNKIDLIDSNLKLDEINLIWDNYFSNSLIKYKSFFKGPKDAIEIFKIMKNEKKLQPDGNTFINLLKGCKDKKDLQYGNEINRYLRESNVEEDIKICTSLIQMYIECGNPKKGMDIFYSLLENKEKLPNSYTVNCILQACIKGKLSAMEGIKIHESLKTQFPNFSWSIQLFSTLINFYAKISEPRKAFEVYSEMLSNGFIPDNVTFVCLLNACKDPKHFPFAVTIHQLLTTSSVQWNVEVFNTLINIYSINQNFQEVFNIFQQIIEHNLKPNAFTFSAIFSGCMKENSLQQATDFHKLLKKYVTIGEFNSNLYNSLFSVYFYHNQLDLATEIYNQMKERNFEITEKTFVTLFSQCDNLESGKFLYQLLFDQSGSSKNQNDAQLTEIPTTQKSQTLSSDWSVSLLNSIIGMFCRLNQVDDTNEIYRTLTRDTFKADHITFIYLLSICSNNNSVEQGQKTVDLMLLHLPKAQWGTSLYNSLLKYYCKIGQVKKGYLIYKNMTAPPNILTYQILLQGCNFHQKHKLGKTIHKQLAANINPASWPKEIFFELIKMYTSPDNISHSTINGLLNDMKLHNVPIDPIIYCISVQAASKYSGIALGVAIYKDFLVHETFKWPVQLYNSLIYFFGTCGNNLELAQRLFQDTVEKDISTYNSMMSSFAIHSKASEAISLFEKMIITNIQPDNFTMLSLLRACYKVGLVDKAVSFFQNMHLEYGVQPTTCHLQLINEMLCKAGDLKKAVQLSTEAKCADESTWNYLLSVCSNFSDASIVKTIQKQRNKFLK